MPEVSTKGYLLRKTTALGIAVLTAMVGLLATTAPAAAAADPGVSPLIVGGDAPSQPYPAMASLQIDHDGDPNFHTCGATLVSHWYALTNAHCVTNDDASPQDPALFHLRIGSPDRTRGGIVAGVAAVLVHADWDWAQDPSRPVADIALLRLNRYVPLTPIPVAARLSRPSATTRLLGWGLTASDATTVPVELRQLDTTLLPASQCAAAGISAGEICVASPHGAGACYGDSGGPALQRQGWGRWADVGGASRETDPTCGIAPTVYTDEAYYRGWISTVMRTGKVPPSTPRMAMTARPTAIASPHWISSLTG